MTTKTKGKMGKIVEDLEAGIAKSRVRQLAADIVSKGGWKNSQGNLEMPLGGKQKLTGFDGGTLKVTLSTNMKSAIDYMLDKREAAENANNTLDNAMNAVESEMKAEELTSVQAVDGHAKKFTITLKPGKTKLMVKAAK